ncbi:hypothetical protein MF271_14600 [Deinococcus sp. KNUC1210]|uniref:DUF6636 domain-containing protein n=1 Tax=Deinococcus sp. KNUC1210 TaxID=2917691 RepID=UPI001EF0E7AC|nr:DUF6636 domain-containing protein [Deinococcus sp. KNUC1210]ULH15170.1 hypothetical protein MF271_14600 [Deinococcus sp. KNUC1210]
MKYVWLLMALFGTGALAQSATSSFNAGFSLPSGRIQCGLFSPDPGSAAGQAALRCDVLEPTFRRPARPADCPLDYGDSFSLGAEGRATFTCHGDTIIDPARPVLAYGQLWQRAGLTCRSSAAGVRCLNIDGHGFELSRARSRVF